MTALETWLQTATRHLCQDSAVQVRTEIREHYESARESALGEGSSREEADPSRSQLWGTPMWRTVNIAESC